MKWNYRILEKIDETGDKIYQLVECHYESDNTIVGVCEIEVYSDTYESMREVLSMMLLSCEAPIIKEKDI